MYKIPKISNGSLKIYNTVEGERIETKIERITTNQEPIKDGAPIIYTERKNGVEAAYNIRTDKWEIACEAMDVVTKQKIAKTNAQTMENYLKNNEKIGESKSTEGTE